MPCDTPGFFVINKFTALNYVTHFAYAHKMQLTEILGSFTPCNNAML